MTELTLLVRVGVTAGESSNPQKAVPTAIRQVFWRILVFYIGTMFFIGILLPYNDPHLLGDSSKAASSPLTIALTNAGIIPAAHLINALIVISVISAGNGSLYVASRTMLFMSRSGKAPKFIGRTNAAGVPWVALICSNLFACIVFLSLSSSAGKIYSALITLSGGKISFHFSRLNLIANHLYYQSRLSLYGQLLESHMSDSEKPSLPKARIRNCSHTKQPGTRGEHIWPSLGISSSSFSKDTRHF